MKKALFIDRDGVINRMVKYDYGWDSPQASKDVKLVEGVEKIISWTNENKILVVEVSNQPGVAKGKMTQKTSNLIETKVNRLLQRKGARIDRAYICPHHPHAIIPEFKKVCDCRKPKPGLIFYAAKELGINLSKSIFLGDKASDVIAGKAIGVKTIIYLHHEDEEEKIFEANKVESDYKEASMKEVFRIIRAHFKSV